MTNPASKGIPPLSTHFFSGGFRPFFLAGALDAALMIGLWVPWFLGFFAVPTALSPIAWHQHELLFGYVPAIIAGFLLTAVPNWTGRPPLAGLRLVLLAGLWLGGRLAIFCSEQIGLAAAIVVASAFLPVLAILMARELFAVKNRRNYKVIAILFALSATQLLFFYEFDRFGRIEFSDRLAIGAVILLIAIIGGRIVPTFTANWLRQNNAGRLPPAFTRFDMTAMVFAAAALIGWPLVTRFEAYATPMGVLMIIAGFLQFIRQLRWTPERTLAEPLVMILHIAFFFIPFGFALTGAALLLDDVGLHTAGIHAWTSGAIGVMTLAVMTRATRGHTGRSLHAPTSTVLTIYIPIVFAALARIGAAILPDYTMLLLPAAGLSWIVAFLGFAIFYGPLILRRTVA